jgi:zinc/manganese transport system substrate-binding protein/manganese/iron transport system substrate-binding protein
MFSVLMFSTACASDGEGGGAQVNVVTSTVILADMVHNVGDDRVEVDALIPSGADPHTFELPPSAVQDIAEADIVFINGLGLEEGIEDIVRTNAEGPVIELTEGITVIAGPGGHEDEGDDHADETPEAGDHADEDEDHAHEEGNPHMWLDPQLASRYVERIRDELEAIDPEGSGAYNDRAIAFLDEIGLLHEEFQDAVEDIPEDNRKLVTFHDAFHYLADRYSLEIVGVVAPSPGQEPSAEDIAELSETIEREDVPAVFKEPQFNSDVLDAAAEDANVQVLDLLSDAYIDGVDSYIELMEFNMEQLVEGLGG